MTAGRVRIYIACSLDGFIAGADDDIGWLDDALDPDGSVGPGAVEFADFMADVGAMLMGRRTFDVLLGFDEWHYGETPILVPTHRPLEAPRPTVRAVSGSIAELVADALRVADGKDVYVDGGDVIRQAVDAGLVDHAIITVIPTVLGRGLPLFAGTDQRHRLAFEGHHDYRGLVQLHARFER